MSGLILALIIGFLLGILLMIFLVAGREEQDLLDRVERTELSNGRPSRAEEKPASKRLGLRTPANDG